MKNVLLMYKNVNSNIWIEWMFRIVFSWAFIQTAVVIQEEHYPDACWLLIFISIWLYFLNFKIVGLLPLLFALFIHYVHFSMQ